METFNWDTFYNNTCRIYTSIVRSIVPDYDDIQDILQDVYITLYEKSHYKKEDLFRIGIITSKNKAIDFYRKRKKLTEYTPTKDTPSEDLSDDKETLALINKYLQSSENTNYLYLFSIGYTYKELADMNGIHIEVVKSKIYNARKKLKSSDLYKSLK